VPWLQIIFVPPESDDLDAIQLIARFAKVAFCFFCNPLAFGRVAARQAAGYSRRDFIFEVFRFALPALALRRHGLCVLARVELGTLKIVIFSKVAIVAGIVEVIAPAA
jgi:hypothetical protein